MYIEKYRKYVSIIYIYLYLHNYICILFCLQNCVAIQCDWWRKFIVQLRMCCFFLPMGQWKWQLTVVIFGVLGFDDEKLVGRWSCRTPNPSIQYLVRIDFFFEINEQKKSYSHTSRKSHHAKKQRFKTSHPWHDTASHQNGEAQVAGTFGSFKYDRESRVPWTWFF